jgi:DNA-binding HxlR family transcriptional regulator
MSTYGQYCPVAKAMELLDERWMLLIVRELLIGSEHFNELRRGLPKMSPALLSKRLQTLVRAGVVTRSRVAGRTCYTLTPRGHELKDIVEGLGAWGMRWIGELGEQDLDPHLSMWDIHRKAPTHAWPNKRTTLAFRLSDVAPKQSSWWLVAADGHLDVCDNDPGYDVTATISASLRTLTQVWRGDVPWSRALIDGSVSIDGPSHVRRAVPTWIGQSNFAAVPRPAKTPAQRRASAVCRSTSADCPEAERMQQLEGEVTVGSDSPHPVGRALAARPTLIS